MYQQKFGGAAQALLDQATAGGTVTGAPDAERLQETVRLYFITDAAKVAALKLVDLHLVHGRFSAAKRLADELLEHHPALGEDRPAVLLRGVVAARFLGDDAAADAYAATIKTDFPEATGTVAGEARNLSAAADAVLVARKSLRRGGSAAGQWPTFAGSPDARPRRPAAGRAPSPPTSAASRCPAPALSAQPRRPPHPGPGVRARPKVRADDRRLPRRLRRRALLERQRPPLRRRPRKRPCPCPAGWPPTARPTSSSYALPGGAFATPRGVANLPSVTDKYVLAVLGIARFAALHEQRPTRRWPSRSWSASTA